ncbi:aryl-alcohol dehydrogenase [Chaetomidium leptoderma]|uniref:Aryl-alcohol dehydrogenase n=1 Tax=Chaetomidium leptoderma TaxID=669021 RepID=A0AAN6VQS5_9PEZI|nr:aryl-alcohol dehydrogenase [Chaetomidium leptoderma]
MSRRTTALVVPELNGKFELREVYLDDIQPDEVLVEIHASGLCHTDLSCATGLLPCEPNAVLGHEGAGVILTTGSAVGPHLSPGDKVLLSFSHCEACAACTSGHPAYCHSFNQRNFGGRRADGKPSMFMTSSEEEENGNTTAAKQGIFSTFFGQSSFARHTLVHRSCVVKVPQETDLALYAPLGCGMQTGAGAVLNSLRVKPGSSVAVFGVGSVGMAAVMAAAKIAGATTVIAVDLQVGRLELAKRLGATHGVLAAEGDVVGRIKGICPAGNGVDYAVDCTGVPAVIRNMIDCLGTRGRGATVGAPGFGKSVSVDVMDHLTYGKEYVGCCEGDSLPSEFIPFLMEEHAKGRFPMEEFVRCYDFEDYEKAIEDTHSGKTIKAVLTWKEGQ